MRPHSISRISSTRARRARCWATAALAGAALAATALGGGTATAGAAEGCDAQPLSQPFLPFADAARYTPVGDAGLEGGGDGWTLTGGARVVADNEPWQVGGEADGQSLRLPAGSTATTPPICIGLLHPTARFFARNAGLALAPLAVEVVFTDATGLLTSLPVSVVLAGGDWQPTLPQLLLANLTTPLTGGELQVQLRFRPLLFGGDWRVDDVFVDPYKGV